jgi:hypothetical protein
MRFQSSNTVSYLLNKLQNASVSILLSGHDGHPLLLTETKYSNLCALCEHPEVCDYPDKYSGYDGALRCLSEHGGQVAWTKVYYVKKHFGVRNPTITLCLQAP